MQPIKWDYVTAPGTHIVQTEIIKYLQCYGELGMYVLYVYACCVCHMFATLAND